MPILAAIEIKAQGEFPNGEFGSGSDKLKNSLPVKKNF